MSDRNGRPRRLARSTPREVEERVAAARRELMVAPLGLAAATGVPARTCARIAARRGMPRLADIDRVAGEVRRRGPVAPVRYELERPGAGPCGRQEGREDPGRRRLEGPRGIRPRAPGLRRRLRLPARRRGRPQPRRLHRAAVRREEGHLRGVHGPRAALLRGAEPARRARDGDTARDIAAESSTRCWRPRRSARLHEALQSVVERQGGAVEPHERAGMAVRQGMGKRGREGVRPPGLHRAL